MTSKSFLVFLIVVCNVSYLSAEVANSCLSYKNILLLFLKDFLNHQPDITKVNLFLCDKIDNLIKIPGALNTFLYFGDISKINDYEVYNETNGLLSVLDLNCSNSLKYLEELDSELFGFPMKWLLLNTRDERLLPNVNALIDSNVFFAHMQDSGRSYHVVQFYKVQKRSTAIIELYGNWSQATGLIVIQKERILSRRRQNLQRSVIRTNSVFFDSDSYNKFQKSKSPIVKKIELISDIDGFLKINLALTLHLIEALNATIDFKPMKSWGYRDLETKEWDGVMKNVIEKKVDIACSLMMTNERLPYLKYLSLLSPLKIQFIFREPPLSYVTNIYSLPFTSIVWMCSFGLLALAVIVIWITMKFQANIERQTELPYFAFEDSDLLLSAISAICQMGVLIDPKILSARIAAFILLTTLIFIFTSYTANIVALLQSTTRSIKTLYDLLEAGVELGVDDRMYNHYYFERITESVRQLMFPASHGNPQFINLSFGMEKVRNGRFAFYVDLPNAYRIIKKTYYEHEKCNLMTIKFFELDKPWFAVPKSSPYKEIIKVLLFRIREYGLQDKMNIKYGNKKPVCSGGQSFGSVRLYDCYAAFKILLYGSGLAVCVLCLEKYIFRCMSNRRNKCSKDRKGN